ncbi:hypothetical protein NIES2134_100890 [Thermostichus vulcanus NIES-2134]|nr:hypothetical protein NIES2134_100890 [Thermostichus vulcanus NIES-2134]
MASPLGRLQKLDLAALSTKQQSISLIYIFGTKLQSVEGTSDNVEINFAYIACNSIG